MNKAQLCYLPNHPPHPVLLPSLYPHQRRSLMGQHRHHGVEPDLAETPDTVPLQPPGLFQGFERAFNSLPLGVKSSPLLAVPAAPARRPWGGSVCL